MKSFYAVVIPLLLYGASEPTHLLLSTPSSVTTRKVPRNCTNVYIGLDSIRINRKYILPTDSILHYCGNREDLVQPLIRPSIQETFSVSKKKNRLAVYLHRFLPFCVMYSFLEAASSVGYKDVYLVTRNKKTNKKVCVILRFPDRNPTKPSRSRESIMSVVNEKLKTLRQLYDNHLKTKEFSGKITVKFVIDQFGEVISVVIVESDLGYDKFESVILDQIMQWEFERIDKPHDATEVVYPFIFER